MSMSATDTITTYPPSTDMNATQAAEYCGKSTAALYLARLEGRLPGRKVNGHVLFRKEDLDAWGTKDSLVESFVPTSYDTLTPPAGDALPVEREWADAQAQNREVPTLTTKQAAAYLGVSTDAILKARDRGALESHKSAGTCLFSLDALDEYNAHRGERRQNPPTPTTAFQSTQPRDSSGRFAASPVERNVAQLPPPLAAEQHSLHSLSKTVTFASGSLCVTYDLDLFAASEQERSLVLGVVDAIRTFEKSQRIIDADLANTDEAVTP